jgi:dUTP pyrophosphatase
MEKNKIEEYIEQLTLLNNSLTDDTEEIDPEFENTLNQVLQSLTNDVEGKTLPIVVPPYFDLDLKVKKLDPNAVIPSYANDTDAGLDLTITSQRSSTHFQAEYGFGIAVEIPRGYVGLIFPRSSVRNYELILSNCVGVIDSGYRGEIKTTFNKTNGLDSFKYKVGDKAAQLIILPYPKVRVVESTELSDTERGVNGFGSTGV